MPDSQSIDEVIIRSEQRENKDGTLLDKHDFTFQNYKKVVLGEKITFNTLGHGIIEANKVDTYDNIYLSKKASIKPRALHEINRNINQALLDFKIPSKYKPNIVIFDSSEQTSLGFYNPIDNTVYLSKNIVNKEVQMVSGGERWTEYHEVYHLKQWSKLFDKGIKINKNNFNKYLQVLMNNSKKSIDKLEKNEYNLTCL